MIKIELQNYNFIYIKKNYSDRPSPKLYGIKTIYLGCFSGWGTGKMNEKTESRDTNTFLKET